MATLKRGCPPRKQRNRAAQDATLINIRAIKGRLERIENVLYILFAAFREGLDAQERAEAEVRGKKR